MNKKMVGYVIAILLIGTMIVIMVKTNTETPDQLAASGTGEVVTSDEVEGLGNGDTPPDFELETLSGDVVKLSDLKGKKVILNFWASWCGPCKAEMPHMEKYYKENKDSSNVEIIAVNLTQAERGGFDKAIDKVEKFVDAYKLTFPIPLDVDGEVMDAYQIVPIPTTYMIGTDGKIKHWIRGPMDEKMMNDLVKSID